MKIHFSIIIFLILFFALSGENINACLCRNDPEGTNTEQKFAETIAKDVLYSDFVFSGTFSVIDAEHVKFKIEKVWKGNIKLGNAVTFFSPNNLSQKHDNTLSQNEEREYFIDSCAYNFQISKSYLVYADLSLNGFMAHKCGRTTTLDKAAQDIKELDRQVIGKKAKVK